MQIGVIQAMHALRMKHAKHYVFHKLNEAWVEYEAAHKQQWDIDFAPVLPEAYVGIPPGLTPIPIKPVSKECSRRDLAFYECY
jgi:hypothetical protein